MVRMTIASAIIFIAWLALRLLASQLPCSSPIDSCVPIQGEAGDYFYIIKEGEAVVTIEDEEGTRKVNHLFKADFFGEKALLSDAPRC